MPTHTHQLRHLSPGGRVCHPGMGPGEPESLGSMAPGPVSFGRVPQERDAEWVPGRAWLGGVSLSHLGYQVLNRLLSLVSNLETSGPALHLWAVGGLTSPVCLSPFPGNT